ncbi:MAG: hypothetical protein K2L66_05825, partial [Paramuribaculum sp.]|nr:hypothetical protein [Paramuribaculum sp.]
MALKVLSGVCKGSEMGLKWSKKQVFLAISLQVGEKCVYLHSFLSQRHKIMAGPFVYRLGRKIFILERGV